MLIESLDIAGAILALAATLCYVQASLYAWPLSILACGVNINLYAQSGIYANSCLSVLYLILSLYGWYFWAKQDQSHGSTIRHLASKYWLVSLVFVAGATLIIGMMLKLGAQSSVAWADALTTSLSLLGEWLICRKIIETWFIWAMVDSIYVGLYWHQDLPFHALLMVLYLIVAVAGYYRWT